MPPRPKILQLPDDLKAELEKRMAASHFSDYKKLEQWLNGELAKRGLALTLTHAALHRYGLILSEKQNRVDTAIQMAKAVAKAAGEEEGTLSENLLRLGQENMYRLLVDTEKTATETRKLLLKLNKAVSGLSRASIQEQKFKEEHKAGLTK